MPFEGNYSGWLQQKAKRVAAAEKVPHITSRVTPRVTSRVTPHATSRVTSRVTSRETSRVAPCDVSRNRPVTAVQQRCHYPPGGQVDGTAARE